VENGSLELRSNRRGAQAPYNALPSTRTQTRQMDHLRWGYKVGTVAIYNVGYAGSNGKKRSNRWKAKDQKIATDTGWERKQFYVDHIENNISIGQGVMKHTSGCVF